MGGEIDHHMQYGWLKPTHFMSIPYERIAAYQLKQSNKLISYNYFKYFTNTTSKNQNK